MELFGKLLLVHPRGTGAADFRDPETAGSSTSTPATHVNGNGHHVNGNTASGGLAHFEVWFSNTKPSHPNIPHNIVVEVRDTLAHQEGHQVDVIFLESCSADTEAFWYEKLGSHDRALYTQLAP
ncbi:hypothetical protein C8J55DRAFT_489144 [Lentinula edodes]|uniref:Uncharacterized protein n=1 Tax=Lentinula lateritia TaxID=40482 RepID=A0A9W9AE44_9AGAR|nr:hypothetical protein C8J55DRAFT_489144 [Lentinula edodes]